MYSDEESSKHCGDRLRLSRPLRGLFFLAFSSDEEIDEEDEEESEESEDDELEDEQEDEDDELDEDELDESESSESLDEESRLSFFFLLRIFLADEACSALLIQ
ncbi:hypothetical protein FHG87_002520 [Trinorchestia longiramus]|nr:hypothetical protein FHG87_002520 [Trinorchestia longiramus]